MSGRGRHAVLVVLAAVLVNLGSLRPGFIHDDHRIIEMNGLTDGLRHVPEIFRSGYWSTEDVQVPNLYRPVTILSFALGRTAHGLRPLGFRATNLLLHVLCSLLVLALARRLLWREEGGTRSGALAALFAALLFAVHPVHTEALGEIVGRAELLSAVLSLGAVLLFLRARDAAGGAPALRAGPATGSLVLFALGLLSKENAVVVPALLLAADLLIVRRRPAWRFHLLSFTVLGGLLALRVAVLGGLNPAGPIHFIDNPIASMPFVEGRSTALAVLARYAALLVWPARLSIDYSFRSIAPASGPLDARALLGAACLVAWGVVVARCWRRAPAVAFGLALGGLALAPVANLLVPIGTILAERLLYLPSAGACLALAGGVAAAGGRATISGVAPAAPASRRRLAIGGALLAIAVLSARSVVRYGDWTDDYAIFGAALRIFPENVRAQFNFGAACEERGEDGRAIEAYEKALAVWPDFADAQYNLAGVQARRKDHATAAAHYRAAVRLEPGNVKYLVNLAHTLTALGQYDESRDLLRRAIDIDHESALAYTDLGATELAAGNRPAAIEAYTQAARLEPSNADYLRNLGVAQREAGDPAAAAATFRSALAIRPEDPDLLDALGLALVDGNGAADALEPLRRAVSARPGHPVFHYHLARALEQSGDTERAVAEYREAIRLAPSVPVPLKGLGLLLARLGDREGAVAVLERAQELDPNGKVMDETTRAVLAGLKRSRPGGKR